MVSSKGRARDAAQILCLPTYRATGRGYFGQQQVVDMLRYLRLLHNRYDDEALVTVLASPFVGVSNDGLVLIRRHAGRRPLFAGIERSLPEALDDDDRRLILAFKQRYDRLATTSTRLSLERLCEQVVSAHDYDLAVLAFPGALRPGSGNAGTHGEVPGQQGSPTPAGVYQSPSGKDCYKSENGHGCN